MTNKVTYRLFALLLIFNVNFTVHAEDYSSYLVGDKVPNELAYLPTPPDSMQIFSNGDYVRWIWGKSVRNTPRGEQASKDSKYGIIRMSAIYSDVLGIEISEENTPAIYRFMVNSGYTGAMSVVAMKHAFFRKRPFMLMNERLWSEWDTYEDLNNNSSYPSSHTSNGWGTALALAEMAPHLQDTILRLGLEYGVSRVIVGAHWQSDVDAAMLTSSATIARAHATEKYIAHLNAAREEYAALKGMTLAEIASGNSPKANKILDAPYLSDSQPFYGDMSHYWKAKTQRGGERGEKAIADANLDDDAIVSGFAPCADIPFSATETPLITSLLKTLKERLMIDGREMKDCWFRKRPYIQMNEPTSIPNEENLYRNESSYPSVHATIGWGIALVLAEVMPECQNSVLKRGYDFGWSRVITGYSYSSDVQAGRVMAACLLAKYHNDPSFQSALEAAKQEYAQKKADQGIEEIICHSSNTPGYWYSISGIIYTSRPRVPGIYIHNGEKVKIGY